MSTAIARNLMAEMKLAGMLAAFDKTVTDATRDQVSYSEFLDALLQAEADYRGERAAQRRLKAAKLPIRVCLDDFDYTAHRSITKAQIREIQSLGWLKDGRPLLLIGQTGVGKSFIAQAIALQVVRVNQGDSGASIKMRELAGAWGFRGLPGHPMLRGTIRPCLGGRIVGDRGRSGIKEAFSSFRKSPHARSTHQRSPDEVVYETPSNEPPDSGRGVCGDQCGERLPDRGRSAPAVPEEARTRTPPTRSARVGVRGRGGADAGGGAAATVGGDL